MNNQIKEHVALIKQKAEYFFSVDKSVHVKLKTNVWKNGNIKELSNNYFILEEFVDGKLECFYLDVRDIVAYKLKEEWSNGDYN